MAERRRGGGAGRAVLLALGAALVLVGVRPFEIPSDSMRETLLPGDYVLVSTWECGVTLPLTGLRLPGTRAPRPGDVLVFRAPRDPREEYCKRVVAGPGQTLEIRDKQVIVDGDTLREPWATHRDAAVRPGGYDARDNLGPVTLAPGQLFVLGDNRDDSDDSRFWGPLPVANVVGRPLVVYWSWDEAAGRVRGERLLRRVR